MAGLSDYFSRFSGFLHSINPFPTSRSFEERWYGIRAIEHYHSNTLIINSMTPSDDGRSAGIDTLVDLPTRLRGDFSILENMRDRFSRYLSRNVSGLASEISRMQVNAGVRNPESTEDVYIAVNTGTEGTQVTENVLLDSRSIYRPEVVSYIRENYSSRSTDARLDQIGALRNIISDLNSANYLRPWHGTPSIQNGRYVVTPPSQNPQVTASSTPPAI